MAEIQYKQGDVVYREGDRGEVFYRVLEGAVDVVVDWGKDSATTLTTLLPGQFFGEMSAMGGYRRSATVVAAADDTKLMELNKKDMDAMFRENPDTILDLMKYLGGRIRTLSHDTEQARNVLEEMKASDGKPCSESFRDKARQVVLYYHSPDRQMKKPSVEAKEEKAHPEGLSGRVSAYSAGTILYKEGEPGRCMYDIHWGRVGIFSAYGTSDQRKLTELSVNQFFGEMGMLCGDPRSATAVILDNDTTVESIYPEDMRELFEKNPPKVWMVFEHIALRLRHLTDEYAGICREICERQ
ncbi:MAG: cyclic nucleotide-binding domain-containing protein [Clostridia bacterium]|nr:cyclic nucleotide-binding domain-containing protein [Clostridia bacterium]